MHIVCILQFTPTISVEKRRGGIEITGLSKCATALWFADHEQFWTFQRLQHTQSFSHSCTQIFTPTHTCHWGPLAPMLWFCLAFRLRHRRPPGRRGTGIISRCLLSSTVNSEWNDSTQRDATVAAPINAFNTPQYGADRCERCEHWQRNEWRMTS